MGKKSREQREAQRAFENRLQGAKITIQRAAGIPISRIITTGHAWNILYQLGLETEPRDPERLIEASLDRFLMTRLQGATWKAENLAPKKPERKPRATRHRQPRQKTKYKQNRNTGFYDSDEWRFVRYDALKRCGRRCLVCGSGPHNGKVLHVDHIKPRSTHPKLELDPSNLQVLCEDCNLGKSNRDSIDWREPDKVAKSPLDEQFDHAMKTDPN